jgi:hypothetical protein
VPTPAHRRRTALRLGGRLALVSVVIAAGALVAMTRASPSPPGAAAPVARVPTASTAPPRDEGRAPDATTSVPPAPVVPDPLVDPALDLRAGPVPVPLALHLPSLGVRADVLGVGLTDEDAMDAPQGGLDDPVWGQAFWYRGSAVPGAPSTALIAGHVGSRGGPGVFARLGELVPGDPVVVQDLRTGVGTRFVVTETVEYTLDEAAQPDVMARIYGSGPVAGLQPVPSTDGRAHLTLVTCAGTFTDGTHDLRRVVSAVAQP